MKIVINTILFTLFLSCSKNDCNNFSQSPFEGKLVWSKSIGGSAEDKAASIIITPDGGSLIVSSTNSNDGDIVKKYAMTDIWLTKFDDSGNLIWSKTIGGSMNDYGTSVINSSDGNYVLAGYSESNDGDMQKNKGLHDFFVAKIDNTGNIIWIKNYGFTSHDHAHKIIQTSDGGYFVAGFADYSGINGTADIGNHGEGHSFKTSKPSAIQHGIGEYFGIKLDTKGDFVWYRYFGGTQNDRVNDIVEANDGGILLVGYSESTDFDISNNKGGYDYWVVKLDIDGHLHWKENYGGSGIDQAFSIAKTKSNSYLIAGKSNSKDGQISKNLGNFDAWIIQIDDYGNLLWEQSFGTVEFDAANTIKKVSNGNFVAVGNTRGNIFDTQNKGENDYWLFEIDQKAKSGSHWQKAYGGQQIDAAIDFVEVKPNEFVIIGESQSNNFEVPANKGLNDLWLIKVK